MNGSKNLSLFIIFSLILFNCFPDENSQAIDMLLFEEFDEEDDIIFSFEPSEDLSEWASSEGWFLTSEDAFSGNYSLYHGNDLFVQSIVRYETNTGEGFLSFYYKGYWYSNPLKLYIDGELATQCNASMGWTKVEYYIDAGPHTFEWYFYNTNTDGYAFIDQVRIP